MSILLKKYFKKEICLLLTLALLLSGCGKTVREPLTKDNLAGKKIGVMAGFSSDYILTDSNLGLDIYRYDAYSDMALAAKFHRIDAAAMEMDEAYVFCRMNPEFKIAFPAAEKLDFGYYFKAGQDRFIDEFNQFVKKFRQTEAYADILKRVEASAEAPYVPKKVVNTVKTDRIIKVAVMDGWEPVSYKNAKTGEWEGADIELITHFVNSLGAKVEFKDESWNQMCIELPAGLVDIMVCPCTLLSKKDMEMSGNIAMSDAVFLKDIVLLVYKEEN